MGLRLGVDIGGTFTDFILYDEQSGTVAVEKCLTTPREPDRAVFEGIGKLGARRPDLYGAMSSFVHATTLVTNTILERKGAKTALVTTSGFRDILEMGRELRYDVYDLSISFPKPIVPRDLRFEVVERVLADGSVLRPLDEDGLRQVAAQIARSGCTAVAVAFLHAYRNPAHERRAAAILRELLPEAAISVSHEVFPEPKEFERTASTAMNAYVKPVTEHYLGRMAKRLDELGYANPLYLMLSNGGTTTVETARDFPIQIVESGPAAGVEAASMVARLMGIDRLLSFDMGGTTAKLCFVENGRAARARTFEVDRVHRFKSGSGIPLAVPVYDLLEIGAGGGSIARIDDLGLLRVGPDSAGSVPGPSCYGNGGTEPTITDADLVLGYLDADHFLGGEMKLHAERAAAAIARNIAEPAGMSLVEAALGIHDLVNETMASAARVYLAEMGQGAKGLTMVGFGGAGPVHAVGLARRLGCARVLIPPLPGVMSSLGLLVAPFAFERSRSIRQTLAEADLEQLEAVMQELEREAGRFLPAGVPLQFRRSVDMQHIGQAFPLEIDLASPWTAPGALGEATALFDKAYARLYGRIDDDTPLEIVSLRVTALSPVDPVMPGIPKDPGSAAPVRSRRVYFSSAGDFVDVPVYRRDTLRPGHVLAGPAIVEERESTTVVGPSDRLSVDGIGSLVIDLGADVRNAGLSHAA